MKLFDAEGGFVRQWNNFFLICSVVALSLDPLFLYVPIVNGTHKCLDMDHNFAIVVCVLRSCADIFYVFHIIIQFKKRDVPCDGEYSIRTTPSPYYVAKRYLTSYFISDVLAALPLPQLAVLVIIPNLDGPTSFSKEHLLKFIIFSQYVSRVIQTSLLYWKVSKTSGFLIERAWVGAAYNFFLYVLASYVFGALWYLFAIESALRCWHIACRKHNCHPQYLYCGKGRVGDYGFLNMSCPLLEKNEIKDATNYDFGIFLDALQAGILETRDFLQKILYCSLWGLQNLSSIGQGLKVSTFYGEILFAYFIVITGLVLYAWLFGNMQKHLQSLPNLSRRIEKMKEKEEAENFMSTTSFPEMLRQQVRREQHNNRKIKGVVDIKSFTRDLSPDLRKDIYRHLLFPLLKKVRYIFYKKFEQMDDHLLDDICDCLESISIRNKKFVKAGFDFSPQVPKFEQMDDHLLDHICDCLKPVRYTENSYLVREGDPARLMLFIACGKVLANGATNNDFYGDELLKWALDPKRKQRPFATREVKAHTNVQAYALVADELMQVVSQFRLNYDRFYSLQWRTQAACKLQFAWRRRCKRLQDALATGSRTSTLSIGASIYVSQFPSVLRVLMRKRRSRIHNGQVSTPKLEPMPQKPIHVSYDEDVAEPKLEHMLPLNVCF